MVVNIFGLVVAIELKKPHLRTFTDFFYVFTFGALIPLICVWIRPENTATGLETQLVSLIESLKDIDPEDDRANQEEAMRLSIAAESAHTKFCTALANTGYEVSYSRLSPTDFRDLADLLLAVISRLHVLSLASKTGRRDSYPVDTALDQTLKQISQDLMHLRHAQLTHILQNLHQLSRVPGMSMTDAEHVAGAIDSAEFTTRLESCQQRLKSIELNCAAIPENICAAIQALETSCRLVSQLQYIHVATITISRQHGPRKRLFLPHVLPSIRVVVTDTLSLFRDAPSRFDMKRAETGVSRLQHWRYRAAHGFSHFQDSRHTRYAVKFATVMAILSIFPFISDWRIWYREVRGHWAMVFAMVVMEITQGFLLRSAIMKITGSCLGGLAALAVYAVSDSINCPKSWLVVIVSGMTFACALPIYRVALNPRFGKAGLVCALAYNLVIGIGFQTDQPAVAFLERTATQLIGIFVVIAVNLLLFPYHARRQLKFQICSAIDELARGFQGIPLMLGDSSVAHSVARTRQKLAYTQDLLRYTKFEPSLKGKFPISEYEELISHLGRLVHLLYGLQTLSHTDSAPIQLEKDMESFYKNQICASMARDLSILSHAMYTKSHTICQLANTLPEEVAAVQKSQETLGLCRLFAESHQLSGTLDLLRKEIYHLISGRSLPGMLDQSRRVSLCSPVPSYHVGRGGGGLASPLQGLALATTLIVPAATPGILECRSTPGTSRAPSISQVSPRTSRPQSTSPGSSRAPSIIRSGLGEAGSQASVRQATDERSRPISTKR